LQPSDEEVLAIDDISEDDDIDDQDGEEDDSMSEDFDIDKRKQEDEDEEGWGPSKNDYYNADAIETEQDALDEEAEARRIQQKQLQSMSEADFAFDAEEWLGEDNDNAVHDDDAGDVVTEVLPQLSITDDMGAEERLKLLKTRYPEFDYMAKEFLDLQPLHDELALAASASETLLRLRKGHNNHIKDSSASKRPPMAVFKYQAIAAYLAAIAMYFALLTSTSDADGSAQIAKSPLELRDHPVMESLVQCRQLWSKVKGINTADPMVDHSGELSSIEEEDDSADEAITNGNTIKDMTTEKKSRKPKKSKAQRAAEAAQAEASARRAEKIRQTEEELAALASLTDRSARRKSSKPKPSKSAVDTGNAEDSDFGDETELTAHELAEKAKKKKSLRFYTSQIAQKAIKRGAAGRDQGGDADIPHRERFRDRQLRLQAEAEKRGTMRKGPGDELGDDSDEEDHRQAQELRGKEGGSDDEYYNLVVKQKKSDKDELAAARALAAREGGRVVETEQIGADGKRKITYQIQKNKGLTPHRKKEVRNPRVKKRMAYDAAKKKLKSQKAVYSGGEGRGGYKGELTGIKPGLVKSVKL
jgi:U3 small nucleolar RNA-associated protein 3